MHEQSGATLAEAHGWPLPSRYTSVSEEYEAITEAAGLLDRSHIGRLSLAGEDALDLLDRLSTNELITLEVNKGIPTVLTSNKGRIIDLLFVLRQSDRLLVLTSPESRQKVAEWIDFYTIIEDVVVEDVTEQTAMLSIAGPKAASFLDDLTTGNISSIARNDSMRASIGGVEATVIRTDLGRLPTYELVAPATEGKTLWTSLLNEGEAAGLRRVGMEVLEVARVEQGVPVYGKELSEDFNPLEANLLEFISFTKGCYVGQEVVARLNTYDKVQKSLVGLRWDSDVSPIPNTKLILDGKQVGVITSVARSPRLQKGIGLGYVRKSHAQPGTSLAMELEEGQATAEVVELSS